MPLLTKSDVSVNVPFGLWLSQSYFLELIWIQEARFSVLGPRPRLSEVYIIHIRVGRPTALGPGIRFQVGTASNFALNGLVRRKWAAMADLQGIRVSKCSRERLELSTFKLRVSVSGPSKSKSNL